MTAASGAQQKLSAQSIAEFYHDNFVTDQVRDFAELVFSRGGTSGLVADVGGGCGYFVEALQRRFGIAGRVLDSDSGSIDLCRARGIDAMAFDALAPEFAGDERLASFNLILHHLVGKNERATRDLQVRALAGWRGHAEKIFVNEYIYESPAPRGLAARLIYEITSSRVLSAAASAVSRVVPSLRANTFGVGVRFRTAEDWRDLFAQAGYRVVGHRRGEIEPLSLPRRLMAISEIRRDSFVLVDACR